MKLAKRILSTLLIFSIVFSLGAANLAFAAPKAGTEAIHAGEKLNKLYNEMESLIVDGNLEQISKKYNSFDKQIKLVEGKIAKVNGKQTKENLHSKYLKKPVATKDRIRYEVSMFKLLNSLDPYLASSNEKKITAQLKKLEKLKVQAKDIKKRKKLKALPKEITKYLSNWESHVKLRTKPIKNVPVKDIARLITLPDKSFNQKEASKMVSRLLKINYKYLTSLNGHAVEIRLIKGKLTSEPEYSYLKGVTPRGWEGTGLTWDDVPGAGGNPTMVRIGYSETGKGHGTINLELHEVGHAVDAFVFSDISNKKKFLAIQRKEQNKFLPDDYFSYPEEYFAESFAYYYLGKKTRDELKKKAPETYKFFKGLESKK